MANRSDVNQAGEIVKGEALQVISEEMPIPALVKGPKRIFATVRKIATPSLAKTWIAANIPSTEIREIETVATNVFGSVELGRQWLEQPNLATYNAAPISLLGSEGGYEHVHQLLMCIEYGNLA